MCSKVYLPVYGPGNEYLCNAPASSVDRLVEEGKVRTVGTKNKVRKLLAICGSEEMLRAAKPHRGTYFSHKTETDDNPKNVWTHAKKLLWH